MRIRFLFDFLSPYAYLGWTQVHGVARHHGAAVEPVAVQWSALLDAQGDKAGAEADALSEHTTRDVLRRAATLGLSLAPPASYPFDPSLALRAASLDLDPGDRRRLIDALFHAAWADGRSLESADEIAAVASEIGLDGPAVVRDANDPATRTRLRGQTEKAVSRGIVAVPAVLSTHPDRPEELFFGPDAIANLDAFLRGDPHVTPEALRRWATIPPGGGPKRV